MTKIRYPLICAVTLCAPLSVALAAEYQKLENIAPESAQEATFGMQDSDDILTSQPKRGFLINALATRSPFWSDSSIDLGIRVYQLRRENAMEEIAEASAAGTQLTFRSGKWRERVSTVVSWQTSFDIGSPNGLDGSGLLGPDQSNLSVISRAWLQLELGKSAALRLYRQDFGMPYINRKDSRMIPITHEAYILRVPGDRLEWLVGQVTKQKQRDSEEFLPMGEVAGVDGSNSGTTMAAARYNFSNKTTLGGVVQHTKDLFTTAFAEAIIPRKINEDWGMQLGAQLTNQWSSGEEQLGDFSTYTWGTRGNVSYRGALLTGAYTKTGDFAIQSPFGGTPGFTSTMLFDFDRAREEAYQIGLSLNFVSFGFPGISIAGDYTIGRGAKTNSGMPLPDEDVVAVTADFRPKRGFLEGLWLRLRFADGDQGSPTADRREVRFTVNYGLEGIR
jgi:hypothetical protein